MGQRVSLTFKWTDICHYPGMYPIGSDEERLLNERREFQKENRASPIVRYAGPLVEHSLIKDEFYPSWNTHLSKDEINNVSIALHHDIQTLIKIDERLRWCRCLLDKAGLPYDRESIISFERDTARRWAYASEVETIEATAVLLDPLDFLKPRLRPFSAPWYAVKVLSHNRRIEILTEKAREENNLHCEFGLAREWMLFGETWAEAKFIINHSKTTISGSKQKRGALAGSDARRKSVSSKTAMMLDKMKRLLEKHPEHSTKWAAQTAFKNGFGSSAESNRKAWYRAHKVGTRHA